MAPNLAKNAGFCDVLRYSQVRVLNIRAHFVKTAPNFWKAVVGDVKKIEKADESATILYQIVDDVCGNRS